MSDETKVESVCSAIGLSQEELQKQVIDRLADRLLEYDCSASEFERAFNREVTARINAEVERLGATHILPGVAAMIEQLCLQKTNQWGEVVGESVTFIEYLTERAEKYITEKVDYDGKSKDESRGGYFKETQTRVAHMVDKHLHYSIHTAMKKALESVNGAIAEGLAETCRIKLQEAIAGLKVTTKIPR